MSAKQPNRKPTGKRKESDASAQEGRERKRAAKRKGLKAGSRQQVEQAGKKSGSKQVKDPRIGSRKPIVLIADEKGSKPVATKPAKEKRVVMTPSRSWRPSKMMIASMPCWIVWMPVKPWRPQSRHGSISGLTVIRS